MAKKVKTRFCGVYTAESAVKGKTHNGKRDVAFYIAYRNWNKKLIWKRIGWASEGCSAKFANDERLRLIVKQKHPETVSTMVSQCTLACAAQKYFEWRRSNGKYAHLDECRYEKHTHAILGSYELSCIKRSTAEDFKQHLSKSGLSPSNAKKVLSTVCSIIGYAIRMDIWEGKNYFTRESGFKMPTVHDKSERFLSPEECAHLLCAIKPKSIQLHDMALLSLHTGLRASEIVRICANDVDKKAGCIWIHAKGNYRERVKAPREILQMLLNYGRAENELIFQDRNGQQIQKISATFYRVTRELGINTQDTPPNKRVIFHTLRHTFASSLVQSGDFSIIEVRDLMRHKTIAMTERYGHLAPNDAWAKTSSTIANYLAKGTQ